MLELLSLLLSLLAFGLAVYASLATRRVWRSIETEAPVAQWEAEIAQLSEELAQTAERVTARLHERGEELAALLERAERLSETLRAQGENIERVVGANQEMGSGEASILEEPGDGAPAISDVEHQIQWLASQGVGVSEIARRVRRTREEVALRLRNSA
ncbi:MAG: hypothetical protein J7M34_03650 [Anaerolineae bacterium]|nr:hypothetical protein [Anaerolineae bacterium]